MRFFGSELSLHKVLNNNNAHVLFCIPQTRSTPSHSIHKNIFFRFVSAKFTFFGRFYMKMVTFEH